MVEITHEVERGKAQSQESLSVKHEINHITVEEVKSSSQVKEFLNLPLKIYTEAHTRFVMPLKLHSKMMMGKIGDKEKHFFIAKYNGQTIARIGCKVHKHQNTVRLHFGFFECLPFYPEATKALVEACHKLYPDLEMMGPFHFRQEDPYVGILVQGFQYDPYFLMPYNPPSYDEMLKGAGLSQIMDLFTYDLKRGTGCPQNIVENGKKAIADLGLTFRTLNRKDLWNEAKLISTIFNEALKNNWGFEEFDDAQIKEMVTMLKVFIDPNIVMFAMKDGKEVACLLCLPNYNPLIKRSMGRLDFGLIRRYFRRAKTTSSFRGYALGVEKEFRSKGVASALTYMMWENSAAMNYNSAEISWILANNSPMNDLAEAMGGRQEKVYRIYVKPPVDSSLDS